MSEHLRVLWRRKFRILSSALLLASVVYVHSSSRTNVFEAESVLGVTAAATDTEAAPTLARTFAALATTRPVVAQAADRSDLRIGTSAALGRVRARAASDLGFVIVTAQGPTAAQAEALGAAVATALVDSVRSRIDQQREEILRPAVDETAELERQLGSRDLAEDAPIRSVLQARYTELVRATTAARLEPRDRVEIVAPARSKGQVSPNPARDAIAMFAAALAFFALVTLIVEALSDRLSTERPAEDVTRLTGLRVLGSIPRSDGAEVVEAFRSLRTSLMFMSTSERLRTLAIVSAEPGAGKTFTALSLAREASALEVPVVLVDGDLRRPVLHEVLRVRQSPGVTEMLTSGSDANAFGYGVEGHLRLVASGAPVADPAGLFGGREFRAALDAMTWAELVVVDTPAASLFADALAIASQCDATIVVVDAQSSRRRPVRNLVDGLRQVGAHPIGVVLNRTESIARPSHYQTPKPPREQRRAAITSR